MIVDTPGQIRDLLMRAKTVAIVGASDNPARPSFFVFRYLVNNGYTVWPVNPAYKTVDGTQCYQSLTALVQAHRLPDVVDVFRRPEAVPEVVEEAIAIGVKTIWFQYGVVNKAAIERADKAGLDVVADRCMKVEHARFSRGLSSQGFNSGLVTARRQPL